MVYDNFYVQPSNNISAMAWWGCAEVQKEAAKCAAKESIRIEAANIRAQEKEREEERKKEIYESILIYSNGDIAIETQNLRCDTHPRKLTNMSKPRLFLLKSKKDEHYAYRLECMVGDRKCQLYISGNEIGNATYLVKKFSGAGIYFHLSMAKTKKILIQLVGILMETAMEEIIPDKAGWMKGEDGVFKFIEEDELTWEKLKKLVK